MNIHHSGFQTVAVRGIRSGIVGIANQHHLDFIFTEHFYLRNLLFRRSGRHVNFTFNSEQLTRISHTLRMVSGTGTNNSTLTFFFGQTRNFIVSTSDFVRTNNLQIFPFQKNIGLITIRKIGIPDQRSCRYNRIQGKFCLSYVY